MQIIDWTKVKKSPVPASAEAGTVLYYRGGGAKIAVFVGSLRVYDADDNLIGTMHDNSLAPEETLDATTSTSMVKTLAQRAVLEGSAKVESAPAPSYAPSPMTMSERSNIALMLSGRSRL